MVHDKVLISTENSNRNPVGVKYEDDKIILVQGASQVTLDRSMLSQLNELRQKSKD